MDEALHGGRATTALAAVEAASSAYLAEVAAGGYRALSDADLLAELRIRESLLRRQAVADHALLAELDQRGIAGRLSMPSTAALLRAMLLVSPCTAKQRVQDARTFGPRVAMSGESLEPLLPMVATGQASGAVSVEHARTIAKVLDRVPGTVSRTDFEAAERQLVNAAGSLLTVDAALRLADDAGLTFLLQNAKGAILAEGRSRRTATRAQTLALIGRDRGCSFPDCDKPPEWTLRHHIQAWAAGGTTDLDNLARHEVDLPVAVTGMRLPALIARGYLSNRTWIGRSSSAHARSAVSTSGGSLRTVRARQQRSPRESERPPGNERMAPANSASCSRTGAIVTPAAARSSRTRTTSISASTSLPMTSARFAAPRTPESRLAATRSAPGSSCTRARIADASRTVIRLWQRDGARLTVHRRGIALWVVLRRVGVTQRWHPAGVRAPIVDRIDGGAADRPGSARAQPAPRRVSPSGPASRARVWHPLKHHATVTTNVS
jgi:hypothetical protein